MSGSPPLRRQWTGRDRPALHGSLIQDENFHRLLFSQHPQHQPQQQPPQVPLDESRHYNHSSAPPRMLHPAAHLPQQSPIMVDLHDQVTTREETPSAPRRPDLSVGEGGFAKPLFMAICTCGTNTRTHCFLLSLPFFSKPFISEDK